MYIKSLNYTTKMNEFNCMQFIPQYKLLKYNDPIDSGKYSYGYVYVTQIKEIQYS